MKWWSPRERQTRIRRPRISAAVAVGGWICLHGCEAGYPPATIENAPWNDDAAAIAAERKALQAESEGAARLTDRLIATEAGRVLVRSLRAHGGWDAWSSLEGLSYERARVLEAPGTAAKAGETPAAQADESPAAPADGKSAAQADGNTPGAVAETADRPVAGIPSRVTLDAVALRFLCPVATFLPGKEMPASAAVPASVHPAHFEVLHPSPPGGEGLFSRLWATEASAPAVLGRDVVAGQDLAEEAFLASLPFCLEDPELVADYLGMEEDLREGVLLERVRYTWPERRARTLCVAWFDRSTFLLRRVLLRTEAGRMVLVDFSGWVDAGGLRVPARREIHRIARLYERPGPDDPRIVDRLDGFVANRR